MGEFFNPQLLEQYAKLDSIQVMMLIEIFFIGGLMLIMFFQARGNNTTTKSLLDNMQTQSQQSNDRENKLATSIQTQANESSKLSKILLLIHKEQKRQGTTQDDMQKLMQQQHANQMKKLDEVLNELRTVKTTVDKQPGESGEIKSRLAQVLGHLEVLIPKIRATGEMAKAPTTTDKAMTSPP